MADSKNRGGGGRKGRSASAPKPGSVADIFRQRAEFRASAAAPKPRQLGRFELQFKPGNPVKLANGRTIDKQVLDQMNLPRGKRPKFRENLATINF